MTDIAGQDQRTSFLDEAISQHASMPEEIWAVWVVERLKLLEHKDLVIVAGRAIGAL